MKVGETLIKGTGIYKFSLLSVVSDVFIIYTKFVSFISSRSNDLEDGLGIEEERGKKAFMTPSAWRQPCRRRRRLWPGRR